jgi:hemolysin III
MARISRNKTNEPLSSIFHFVGTLFALLALILLVLLAAFMGKGLHVIGFAIFGASMIMLYTTSGIYHLFRNGTKGRDIMKRFDHSMIYILIAGTYTPIGLIMPDHAWGWSLLIIIWLLAIGGVFIKMFGIEIKDWISTLIYILMGWLIIVALGPLMQWLPFWGLFYLFLGGLFYTLGVIFYFLDEKVYRRRWWGMHEIWHLFVLGGSVSHFLLMLLYVLYL